MGDRQVEPLAGEDSLGQIAQADRDPAEPVVVGDGVGELVQRQRVALRASACFGAALLMREVGSTRSATEIGLAAFFADIATGRGGNNPGRCR